MSNLTNENKSMIAEMCLDFINNHIDSINKDLKKINVLSPNEEQKEIFNSINENLIKIKTQLDKINKLEFPQ